ncbi:MAG TPA: DUF6531 domain-containing protein [Frankiaceae bacterium]|nr:DUF6531 domain-containing protein [Frankiaceae bacterium]
MATRTSTTGEVGGPDVYVTGAQLGSWHWCDQYADALYAAFPMGVCGTIRTTTPIPDYTQGSESWSVRDSCGVSQYSWSSDPGSYWRYPSTGSTQWMALPVTRVRLGACYGTWTVAYTYRLFVNGSYQGGTVTEEWEVRAGAPSVSIYYAQMFGNSDSATPYTGSQADPVNSLTGALSDEFTDAAVAARGGGLAQVRSYTSADDTVGELGRGWTYAYEESVSVDPTTGTATVHLGTGQRLTFTRNADGTYAPAFGVRNTLVRRSDGTFARTDKQAVTSAYDPQGRLVTRRDRNGQGPTLAYGADGRLATVSSSGRTLTFAHDPVSGRLTRVTLPDERYVAYGYDAAGLLETVRATDGQTTTYGYDAGGRLTSIRDPNGDYPVRTTYDPQTGRVVEQRDARAKLSTFSWDLATQTQTMTDPRGKVWRDVYSGSFLVRRIDPEGGTTHYAWSDQGNLVAVTTPLGETTTFDYNSAGNLLRRTGPRLAKINNNDFGDYETYTYNTLNDLTRVNDFKRRDTYFFYDTKGNPSRTESPFGTVRGRAVWNADGTVLSTTNARGKTTTYEYTAAGDRSKATDPLGNVTTFFFDGVGRLTSTVPPRGNVAGANPDTYRTRYTYDDADRPRTTTDPLGNVSELRYDPGGRVEAAIDARLKATTFTYDAAGHVLTSQGPDPSVAPLRYTYDDNGNVATATDSRAAVSMYSYDGVNRQTQVTGPAGTWQWTYDLDGRTKTLVAPTGRTITYAYTDAGLVSGITYSDGTPGVSFTYDAKGNRLTMTDAAGTASYAYDNYDRLLSVTRGTDVLSYTWDATGNVATRTFPGQTADTFTYDDVDRLVSLTRGGAALVTYAYDTAAGKRTATFPNGTVETITTDAAARVAEVKTTTATATLTRAAISYDPNGNPLTIRNGLDVPTTYTYDDLDRLTAVCYSTVTCTGATDFVRYAYDGNDNRLTEQRPAGTTTWTYNAANRPMARSGANGAASYTYDLDGNLLSDGTTTFTWNASRLPVSAKVGSKAATFTYDGDGRRRTMTKSNVVTQYVWDPLSGDLALEREGAGAVQRRYTYGLGLVGYTAGGADYFYATDQLGSVRTVTSASGALQWSYEYEPYGRTRTSTSAGRNAPANPRQYIAGYNDGTDYHLGARAYNPADASFRSADPVWRGSPGTGYGYGNANPMAYTDPLGLDPGDNIRTAGNVSLGVAIAATAVTVLCPVCAPVSGPIATAAWLVNAGTGLYQAYQSYTKGAYALAAFQAAMAFASGKFGLNGLSRQGGGLAARYRGVTANGERGSIGFGELPRNAKTFADFDEAAAHLQRYHGVDPRTASARLHSIKAENGFRGDDNLLIDRTGNVFNPFTRERLGTLTQG